MRIKGETPTEISAFASVMREKGRKLKHDFPVAEIVGTGGDCANTFNISTVSGFVVSAAGMPIAKHGNRSVSSKCGAADVLEALGVKIDLPPEQNEQVLSECGMCFMFAQKYHSAMKYVGPVRKEIGIPTVFNILGPLTNPAHANVQLLGVYKPELLKPMSEALTKLGVKRGMAVYGQDKLDEISVGAPTSVVEFEGDKYTEYEITPEQFGLERHSLADLKGGEPKLNAEIAKKILGGEKGAGRDAVLLNAGAALHIYKGITIADGVKLAAEMIDSGAALKTLEKYVSVSNTLN